MDLSKFRFLIADDSSMIRDMIERCLKKYDARRVDIVENGQEAINKINRSISEGISYDLVTLDWEMPEKTGLEVIQFIRSTKETKKLKVILITSVSFKDNVSQALDSAPDDYIVKPFKAQELEERILRTIAKVK